MPQAVSTLVAYRCWDMLSVASLSWLLTTYALCLLDFLWRRRWPASYRRWREALAALLWLNCFRGGAPWLLMRRFLDGRGVSAAGGVATHAAHLLFASGAPQMAVHLLTLRMRLRQGGFGARAASRAHEACLQGTRPKAMPATGCAARGCGRPGCCKAAGVR